MIRHPWLFFIGQDEQDEQDKAASLQCPILFILFILSNKNPVQGQSPFDTRHGAEPRASDYFRKSASSAPALMLN